VSPGPEARGTSDPETAGVDRRDFARLAGGTLLGALSGERVATAAPLEDASASPVRTRPLMKVGTQHGSSDEVLTVLAALGVDNICADLPSERLDGRWSVESLRNLRERVESFGIHLDMLPLPMSSHPIGRAEYPSILLARSPERERAIDDICRMIRNTAEAGIPALKYNLTFLGVVRTEPTKGRGGAQYSTFSYAKARQEPPLTEAGPVPADIYWDRITYFLERVVPVAEEHKVRLACHPQDPGMPPGRGYRGVETVLGSVFGLKRFVSIHESPYHGLNFCQGTYDGMMMPDHVPTIAGDDERRQAFAYTFGYIKALIRALQAEAA
jgi:mannonate dehydratase